MNKRNLKSVVNKLLGKLDKASEELDCYMQKRIEKRKKIGYDEENGKPVEECIHEEENFEIVNGIVDRTSLKQLVDMLGALNKISNGEEEADKTGGVILIPQANDNEV